MLWPSVWVCEEKVGIESGEGVDGCLGKMSPAGGRRKPNSGQGAAGSIVSVKWEWGGWFRRRKNQKPGGEQL